MTPFRIRFARVSLGWVLVFALLMVFHRERRTFAQQATPRNTTTQPAWPEVAPILYDNCTTCHHPHGNGPFSLLTYEDARRWGPQIAEVTSSRYMPPWLPAHGYGEFAEERSLSSRQIDTLVAWVKAGMPQGDAHEAPSAPSYTDDWIGGKPDLILKVQMPFSLPAGGTDLFHNFILPFPLKQARYVRAMEIRPSAPEVVHHANVLIDRTASLRRLHPADWQNGVEGMELNIDAGNTFDPEGHFLFWKPDTPVIAEEPGMAWEIDPGNDLVLNMHLKPSGKPTLVSAEIGLYFTSAPPTRQPMLLQLEHDDALDIPAGDAAFTVEDHLKLPVAVDLLGIYPHAHYLGKDLRGWAILPDGSRRWLIWIKDWDIDRQAVYRLRQPLHLPRGSVVSMRYTYDNSAANPHNPHIPPVRVHAGQRSEDEMGHLWLQVLASPAGPNAPDPRLQLEEAWMERRLEKTPNDPVARYNLASALEGEGQFKQAAENYAALLKLQPNDPRALNGAGTALDASGDWQAARVAFERAARVAPDDCDARFNLARVDLRHNLPAEAESEFRYMLGRCPEDAPVHSGLGAALAAEGQNAAAQEQFQAALRIDPNDFTANYNLGTQQLQAGDAETARLELSKAVQANARDTDAREHLALACAQTGRISEAIEQMRAAAVAAPDDPDVHAVLAQLLSAAGEDAQAIQEEKESLRLRSGDADQWNNLGVMQARVGDQAAAAADFKRALELQPGHTAAAANLQRLQRAAKTH